MSTFTAADNAKCAICWEKMNKGSKKILSCNHPFHIECIEKWLKETNTCPICRGREELTSTGRAAAGARGRAAILAVGARGRAAVEAAVLAVIAALVQARGGAVQPRGEAALVAAVQAMRARARARLGAAPAPAPAPAPARARARARVAVAVGFAVGAGVGAAVGAGLGSRVGTAVGAVVGALEGFTVGAAVQAAEVVRGVIRRGALEQLVHAERMEEVFIRTATGIAVAAVGLIGIRGVSIAAQSYFSDTVPH